MNNATSHVLASTSFASGVFGVLSALIFCLVCSLLLSYELGKRIYERGRDLNNRWGQAVPPMSDLAICRRAQYLRLAAYATTMASVCWGQFRPPYNYVLAPVTGALILLGGLHRARKHDPCSGLSASLNDAPEE